MPMLNMRYVLPDDVIDLNRVEGLSGIAAANGSLGDRRHDASARYRVFRRRLGPVSGHDRGDPAGRPPPDPQPRHAGGQPRPSRPFGRAARGGDGARRHDSCRGQAGKAGHRDGRLPGGLHDAVHRARRDGDRRDLPAVGGRPRLRLHRVRAPARGLRDRLRRGADDDRRRGQGEPGLDHGQRRGPVAAPLHRGGGNDSRPDARTRTVPRGGGDRARVRRVGRHSRPVLVPAAPGGGSVAPRRSRRRRRAWEVPMADRRRISVTINGDTYEREVETRLLLSDFIRHECELTGTHVGCEHGVCGACTILLDGDNRAKLPDARRPGRRARVADDRGDCTQRGRVAPAAAGVHGQSRAAMRLLHAGEC